MNNTKLILNQDWTYETQFFGSKTIKTLYKKGEIFEFFFSIFQFFFVLLKYFFVCF